MTTDTHTIETLAEEAYVWFGLSHRSGDSEDPSDFYYHLKDGRPDWIHDLVHDAHAGMFPDDWRYNCIRSALSHLEDGGDPDDAHEFADGFADVYTGALTEWLGSHMSRPGYCDQAVDDLGIDPEQGITHRIQLGQYMEASEVYHLVVQSLRDRLDEIEEEEDV